MLPTAPVLPSLTKNRVSNRPHVRPPTTARHRGEEVESAKAATPSDDPRCDNVSAESASDEETEQLFIETTV